MQLVQADLFKDFPSLKFVIPHGGGAVPYHWGRYVDALGDLSETDRHKIFEGNALRVYPRLAKKLADHLRA